MNSDIFISNWNDVLDPNKFNIIVIYDTNTIDYKGMYAARLFLYDATPIITNMISINKSLEALISEIPKSMVFFDRLPGDASIIIGTYL